LPIKAALGHRRLSIIDLSEAGHQPMSNKRKTIWVVLNGEIYNYQELRENLIKRGHSFYTHSDTETIVHLYEDLGKDCLSKIDGMFAFAIWDSKKEELFLARDRFGIKPFFYVESQGRFLFASEIKALLEDKEIKRDIDFAALDNYLSLLSEVPLGVFLSGGLDSTSIVASVANLSSEPLKTFTIGFKRKSYSELLEAELVAKMYGCFHQGYIMEPQIIPEILPEIITHIGEPLGDLASTAEYLVSKFAKRDVTVVLRGNGGDEVFGGYPTHYLYKIARIYRRFPFFLHRILENVINNLPVSTERLSFDYKLKSFIRAARYESDEKAHFGWKEIFNKEDKERLYSNLMKEEVKEHNSFEVFSQFFEEIKDFDIINKLLYLDLRVFMAGCGLAVGDFTSMAHSLEARFPFLDHKLVEFASTIPPELKVSGFRTKYIFRKAMAKYLPKRIIKMKKRGFVIPMAEWLKLELKDYVRNILSSSNIRKIGLLNEDYVNRLLDEHFNGKRDNTRQITCLLSLSLWYELFV
ncbi:MAG: asparagine synthase-related protein, partial [bacterium]